VDLQNDGTADDTLFLQTTLTGVIDSKGFGGTVDGFAAYSLPGSSPGNLNLSLSDTSVDGKFFGNAADVVAGTYSADMAFSPPVGPGATGTLSGFFIAE
jgi:hypothetical protein